MVPSITAVFTIVETKEVTTSEFKHAGEMMDALLYNLMLAEIVYLRPLTFKEPEINGDDLKLTVYFADNSDVYLTVEAHRHMTAPASATVH